MRVKEAILDEITSGRLGPKSRVIQDQIAKDLGVSRQPVQQALHILRSQGVVRDAPGRGLEVVPLDLDYVQNVYDLRAVIEGLAGRQAALRRSEQAVRKGKEIIDKGKDAVRRSAYREMVACDMEFHNWIYALAGNPLISATMDTHWTTVQRVMGEVLHSDEKPRNIWNQHEKIVEAIADGDADKAEEVTKEHIILSAGYMIERLRLTQSGTDINSDAS
ncbi:GntR family transcriptional regulator [Marinobacter sp.]|uniref:GntR family transcriptional regulator n=1 Tax=Marinobacter sp. TaxID=50741 RepID=UPI003BA93C9F